MKPRWRSSARLRNKHKPLRLHQTGSTPDVEHNAVLINGAPEIVLHALDPDEDLVHVPLVAGWWPTTPQAVGETRSELLVQMGRADWADRARRFAHLHRQEN